MRTLLIVNPNTSTAVSTQLLAVAQRAGAAWPGVGVQVAAARFGPRYITGEVGAAVAGHAALDAYAAYVHAAPHASGGLVQKVAQTTAPSHTHTQPQPHARTPAAVLLGCFGDPGLFALRALSPAPVLGLAEAAMRAAALGGPFVVVTGGPAWVPMLHRLADALALPAPMCGVQTVDRSGGELAADPQAAAPLLAEAARQALLRWPQAQQVLLGGAGLAGLAEPVAALLGRPVLCNVKLALHAAFEAAAGASAGRALATHATTSTTGTAAATTAATAAFPTTATAEPGPWNGLSPELSSSLLFTPAAS
ncbi:MAG: hypothetical protein AD742_09280 [Methylibium sp. NZG]|nr:MAG: hypothetical protein AD742_09280 [Methylibium sp. NZG]